MKRIVYWALAAALLLSACGSSSPPSYESESLPPSELLTDAPGASEPPVGSVSPPPESSQPEDPSDTPPPASDTPWLKAGAGLLCDYETLELLDGNETDNSRLERVLMEHDALIYCAAAATRQMERYFYKASFAIEQDTVFLWHMLRELMLYHSVLDLNGESDWAEVPADIVKACYNGWFRPGASDNLPQPPDSMAELVKAGDGVYLFYQERSEAPTVEPQLAYSDTDEWERDILSVYISISFGNEEYPTEAYLALRIEDGRYVLSSYGLIADGDSLEVSHTVTERQIVIEVPEELLLIENSGAYVRLETGWGVTAEIMLEPMSLPLSERGREQADATPNRITSYTARLGEEYGIISHNDGVFLYVLLCQISSEQYARVTVAVPEEWVYDYYLLAERIMLTFGADGFPQESYDDLDDYIEHNEFFTF